MGVEQENRDDSSDPRGNSYGKLDPFFPGTLPLTQAIEESAWYWELVNSLTQGAQGRGGVVRSDNDAISTYLRSSRP